MQEEKEKGFFFCFYKKKDGRCKRKGKGFPPPRCGSLAKEKKKRQMNGVLLSSPLSFFRLPQVAVRFYICYTIFVIEEE